MRKINYLFVIVLILTSVSCNKFLDTKPTDVYTPVNYYNTQDQLQQALNSAYGNLMNPSLYGQVIGFNFDASNDELLSGRAADGDTRGLRFNFDASNQYVAGIYRYCYVGIQGLNELLDNINKPQISDSARGLIKAQALFLRGYYYFLLTSNFGDVPLLLHVPAISDVNISAAKQADVYAQIETDMKAAEDIFQQQNYTSAKLGYNDVVTLTAVQAVLARVYIYWAGYPQNNTDKYNDALTYCNKVINSGLHALNPDYRQVFINLVQDVYDTKEIIWEIGSYGAAAGTNVKSGNDIGNFVGIASNYIVGDTSSWAAAGWVYVTQKLFDAYQTDSTSTAVPASSPDIRRDWDCANYYYTGTVRTKYTVTSPWRMYAGKLRRQYSPSDWRMNGIYGINWPVIRYSDVLLMKAEAENYLKGPDADAYEAINEVRKRGYGLMNGNVVKSITITNSGSGYIAAPIVTLSGGGKGASAIAQISGGQVSGIYLSSPGTGKEGANYTSAPAVILGTPWASGTNYATGMQVTNEGKLYTVTTAGISSGNPPIQNSGASDASVTGAVFTYAGIAATAAATLTTGNEYLLTPGLNKTAFQLTIRDERLRELNAEALRRHDLIRWGSYVNDMADFASYSQNNGITAATTSTGGGNPNGLVGLQNITAKDLLLPVPSYELNLNHALQQNPGW